MIKRWIKTLLVVLLVLFVLLAAFLLFERVRGQIALARYKRELIAQGEKLSPQDFVQPVSDAKNGAPDVISATELLKRGTVLPLSRPPVMKLMPSGRALVGFREPEWIDTVTYRDGEWLDEKVTNRWSQLAADLEANALVLREIRAALEKPVLNNKVDLSKGMNLNVQHLSPPKRLSQWFGPASQLALHEERTHNALGYLLLQVRLLSFLAEDHLVISELVRIALAGIARVHTWEALQADPWTDEDLAELQRAWEHQSFSSALARALEGERVNWYVLIEIGRQSNQNAAALFGLETDCPNDPSAVLAWEKFKANRTFGKKVADFSRNWSVARCGASLGRTKTNDAVWSACNGSFPSCGTLPPINPT